MQTVNDVLNLAAGYAQQARYDKAEALYRQLAQSFPHKTDYLHLLMDSLYRQQRVDDAYAVYAAYVHAQNDGVEAAFDEIYLAAMRATGSQPWPLERRRRFHALVELFRQTEHVDSHQIAECGCFRGLSSCLLLSYLRTGDPEFRGAGYHIFDSFAGLSAPTDEDAIDDDTPRAEKLRLMCQPGAFAAGFDEVRRNLAAFPAVEFHRGWIPLTFHKLPERRYRFVHVDVDLYDPTLESLEYFYPRLAVGGIIASDDYNWPGARRALEEFCTQNHLRLNVNEQQQAWLQRGPDSAGLPP